jgi:hypothetical protein
MRNRFSGTATLPSALDRFDRFDPSVISAREAPRTFECR